MKKNRVNNKAFTLVELIVVVAIIGTISAIGIPVYKNQIEKARIAKAVSDIHVVSKDILLHMIDCGLPPKTLSQMAQANLTDPWGNPYEYLQILGDEKNARGKWRKDRWQVPLNSDFDLYSMGKDGKSRPPLTAQASWDDIVRANNGGWVGLATEY